jgi:glutamyl-tRNA reductase
MVLDIRQQAEAIRDEEIVLLVEAVPELSRKADKALHLMTKRLVRRLLEQPLQSIRKLAAEGASEHDLDLIRELFGCGECRPERTAEDEQEDE